MIKCNTSVFYIGDHASIINNGKRCQVKVIKINKKEITVIGRWIINGQEIFYKNKFRKQKIYLENKAFQMKYTPVYGGILDGELVRGKTRSQNKLYKKTKFYKYIETALERNFEIATVNSLRLAGAICPQFYYQWILIENDKLIRSVIYRNYYYIISQEAEL